MNRLPEFRVEHPNLNPSPIQPIQGKKRFIFHKNKNSCDFALLSGDNSITDVPRHNLDFRRNEKRNLDFTGNYIGKLKELLNKKTKELEGLEKINNNMIDLKILRSHGKIKHIKREMNLTPEFQFNSRNQVKNGQHKYTKSNPKIFDSNPIVGYSTRKALSPDRRLADYGNLIFNSSFKYYLCLIVAYIHLQ